MIRLLSFQRRLHPSQIVLGTRKRHAPIALEWVETKGVFLGVRAVDGVVVIEAVDLRAWAVAGDDDSSVFGGLFCDYAGGEAVDGTQLDFGAPG